MFHRFHGGRRKKPAPTGKWQRMPRTGVAAVKIARTGDWEVRVTQRQTGTTIRRQLFSVTLRAESPHHEEFLTGFSSLNAATAAAERRIRILDSVRRRAAQRHQVHKRRSCARL